jgi:hypothetical protein
VVQRIFLVVLWALGLGLLARLWRLPRFPFPRVSRETIFVNVVLLALGVLVAWISYYAGRAPDDWSYLLIVQYLRTHESFAASLAVAPREQLRFAIQVWFFLQAFLSRTAQFDAVLLARAVMPSVLAPLSLFALYAWAKEFCGKVWAGLLAVAFQLTLYVIVGRDAAPLAPK